MLELEQPDDARVLFTRLGVILDAPEAFCNRVRTLVAGTAATLSDERRAAVRAALGKLGPPPKRLLQQMLALGSLTRAEMAEALETPPKYVSDAVSIEKMLAAMDEHRLVDTDPADRWGIKPELAALIQQILEPSALAQRCLSLADDLRSWVSGHAGLIDTNAFEDRFRESLTALHDKLARDHAFTDPVLTGIPSGAERVRAIADALVRLAWELPTNPIS